MKQKLIIYFLFCTALTQAQNKMDNWWYLGTNIGQHPLSGGCSINFTYDSAFIDTTSINNEFFWTLSMISDSSGKLLFYNDMKRVYDRNNNVLPNGDTLMNTYAVLSPNYGGYGPQSSIILPLLDTLPIYNLFSFSPENDIPPSVLPSHLYLAKIDMSLNNGNGAVISKNQALNWNKMDGYINAVKHGNGRDWWVLCHSAEGDTFYTFLLTPQGVSGPFTQIYGHINTWAGGHSSQGVQYFSPDGSKYVNCSNKRINLYDFDRCIGLLSNWQEKKIYGTPIFSPNSQLLYLSTGWAIEQYDLTKTNWKATRDTVAVLDSIVFDSCDYEGFTWPYLAADNRIYIPGGGACRRNIHVIDSPDVVGIGCKVLQNKIIMPRFHRGTIPNYPNYRLGLCRAVAIHWGWVYRLPAQSQLFLLYQTRKRLF
ncbi:MAG: hypothetical protein IPO27_09755 [Bacteroidetes bacterium]|nr:hypothetical protein [Bacteroidota bacterium]